MARTVEKALRVVEAVAEHQPVDIKALSNLLQMPIPTVYRFISTLEEKGYIQRSRGDGKYQLGLALGRLGAIALSPFRLSDFVHPLLRRVSRETGESASFQIRRDLHAICIDYAESDQSLRLSMHIGQVTPLYAGSGPKVLLAHVPEAEREKIIGDSVLKPIGPGSIKTKRELRRRLAAIIERGYDMSQEELTENARGIAVPVLDASGRVIAAMTVSGPKIRLQGDVLQHALCVLRKAAAELSGRFPADFVVGGL